MARKDKNQLPEAVFIGATMRKRKHRLVVFKIEARKDGLPRTCTMLRDEEQVHVEEGMEFMTGYVLEGMLEPNEKTDV